MQSVVKQSVHDARPYIRHSQTSNFIPALSLVDPRRLGVCLFAVTGECFQSNHSDISFSILSVSKLFSLTCALNQFDPSAFFRKVGTEPSGNPFYMLVHLEYEAAKPSNPFINAGAMAVTGMIDGNSGVEKFSRLMEYLRFLVHDESLRVNTGVYGSESANGFINRAVSDFMKRFGVIESDAKAAVDAYFRQCAVDMTCTSLARSGLFPANNGIDPLTRKPMIRRHHAGSIVSAELKYSNISPTKFITVYLINKTQGG